MNILALNISIVSLQLLLGYSKLPRKFLKDGDLVDVNAEQGIVKIFKKAEK